MLKKLIVVGLIIALTVSSMGVFAADFGTGDAEYTYISENFNTIGINELGELTSGKSAAYKFNVWEKQKNVEGSNYWTNEAWTKTEVEGGSKINLPANMAFKQNTIMQYIDKNDGDRAIAVNAGGGGILTTGGIKMNLADFVGTITVEYDLLINSQSEFGTSSGLSAFTPELVYGNNVTNNNGELSTLTSQVVAKLPRHIGTNAAFTRIIMPSAYNTEYTGDVWSDVYGKSYKDTAWGKWRKVEAVITKKIDKITFDYYVADNSGTRVKLGNSTVNIEANSSVFAGDNFKNGYLEFRLAETGSNKQLWYSNQAMTTGIDNISVTVHESGAKIPNVITTIGNNGHVNTFEVVLNKTADDPGFDTSKWTSDTMYVMAVEYKPYPGGSWYESIKSKFFITKSKTDENKITIAMTGRNGEDDAIYAVDLSKIYVVDNSTSTAVHNQVPLTDAWGNSLAGTVLVSNGGKLAYLNPNWDALTTDKKITRHIINTGTPINCDVYVARYSDGDEILEEVGASKWTIPTGYNDIKEFIGLDTAPAAGETVKVFVWSDDGNLTPILPVVAKTIPVPTPGE